MPNYSQENKIISIIEIFRAFQNKINQRCAIAIFNVFQQTFND